MILKKVKRGNHFKPSSQPNPSFRILENICYFRSSLAGRERFFSIPIYFAYAEDRAYARTASARNHTLTGEECITPNRNPFSDESLVLQEISLIGGCPTKALVPANGKDKNLKKCSILDNMSISDIAYFELILFYNSIPSLNSSQLQN